MVVAEPGTRHQVGIADDLQGEDRYRRNERTDRMLGPWENKEQK